MNFSFLDKFKKKPQNGANDVSSNSRVTAQQPLAQPKSQDFESKIPSQTFTLSNMTEQKGESNNPKIVFYEVTRKEDVRSIVDSMKEDSIVVFNFLRMSNRDDQIRAINFIDGAVYAYDYHMESMDGTFLLAPDYYDFKKSIFNQKNYSKFI